MKGFIHIEAASENNQGKLCCNVSLSEVSVADKLALLMSFLQAIELSPAEARRLLSPFDTSPSTAPLPDFTKIATIEVDADALTKQAQKQRRENRDNGNKSKPQD